MAAVEIGQGDYADPVHHNIAVGQHRGYSRSPGEPIPTKDPQSMDEDEYQSLNRLIFNYKAVAEQRIAPHLTYVNAIQTEVILYGAVALDFPREPLPPYPAVGIVMMIKD